MSWSYESSIEELFRDGEFSAQVVPERELPTLTDDEPPERCLLLDDTGLLPRDMGLLLEDVDLLPDDIDLLPAPGVPDDIGLLLDDTGLLRDFPRFFAITPPFSARA